jgi:hypothetical protein
MRSFFFFFFGGDTYKLVDVEYISIRSSIMKWTTLNDQESQTLSSYSTILFGLWVIIIARLLDRSTATHSPLIACRLVCQSLYAIFSGNRPAKHTLPCGENQCRLKILTVLFLKRSVTAASLLSLRISMSKKFLNSYVG